MTRLFLLLLSAGVLAACAPAATQLAKVSGPCYPLNQGPPVQWQVPAELPCPQ